MTGPESGSDGADMTESHRGLVTFGETLALLGADDVGALRPGRSFSLSFGGSESNVAIGVARLGEEATWMGMVGDDTLGDLVLRELRAEGVTVHASRHPTAATSVMLKERPVGATTRVHYYRAGGAGSQLSLDDIDLDAVRRSAVLHVTGITAALSERMAELTAMVMDIARSAGTIISLDLNYRAKLWDVDQARAAYARLLPKTDLVFAGASEAAIAVGRYGDAFATARALAEQGPTGVVVTLGSRGAVAIIDGHEHTAPGVPVRAVDTVGAGDGFVAGYLAELLRGAEPAERLALGNAVGAYVCQIPGDWEGLPFRQQLVPHHDPVQR